MEKDLKFTLLLFTTLVISICSIVYELIIGSLSSYLLGDSVKQFSITIGLYLSAMGLGSYISKYIEDDLFDSFVLVEIFIGVLGGLSSLLLFLCHIYTEAYVLAMYLLIIFLGFLVGLEIPLLIRIINQNSESLKVNIANLFAFDYIGGLVGSVAFPMLLLPKLGFITVAFFAGILNLSMALMIVYHYKTFIKRFVLFKFVSIIILIIFVAAMFFGDVLTGKIEGGLYRDTIIYSHQTIYQKIIITKHKDDLRLYLDGNIQFSSNDEYRYHEALVHIPLSVSKNNERVLVLGGGDGLALREILKYDTVKEIVLVDIDEEMVKLCRTNPEIVKLNRGALDHPKVTIVYEDAFLFLQENDNPFDAVIIDLPDPNNEALNKLYTASFYRLVGNNLTKDGVMVTQSISPYYTPEAFWCINQTVSSAFDYVVPYHLFVPSFGDWGFNLASKKPLSIVSLQEGLPLQYLNSSSVKGLFLFSQDEVLKENIQVNTIFKPVLIDYYAKASEDW